VSNILTKDSQNFFLDLNVDVSKALSPKLNLAEFRKSGSNPKGPIDVWHIPKEKLQNIFNVTWLDYFVKRDLEVTYALIFYRDKNYFHNDLHVDTIPDPLTIINYAVNFVYDLEDDSEMIWYKLDPRDGTLEENFSFEGGLPTITWNLDQFYGQEVARKTIGRNLVLVNTSYPHTVQTYTKPRWSFSLRFTDLDTLSWQEAVKKFSRI